MLPRAVAVKLGQVTGLGSSVRLQFLASVRGQVQDSNLSIFESATDSADASASLATDVHHAMVARSSRTSVGEYSNASDTSIDTVIFGTVSVSPPKAAG